MKSPILKIGNKGFTVIEVLLATVVFTVGMLFIYPAFFKCADLLFSISSRSGADLVANNLLLEAEKDLRGGSADTSLETSGKVIFAGQEFQYQRSVSSEGASGGLYRAQVVVRGPGSSQRSYSKTAYLIQ